MSITLRFALTLGALLFGLIAVLLVQRWFESRDLARQSLLFQTEQSAFLRHWLNADSQSLVEETRALSRRMATSQPHPRSEAPPTSSRTLWELSPEGVLTDLAPGLISPSEVPLFNSGDFLLHALRPDGGWFYFKAHGEFFQAGYAPIEARKGWLFLIRRWDSSFLRKLGSLVGGTASLTEHLPSSPESRGRDQLSEELLDWRGLHLQTLIVKLPRAPEITRWAPAGRPTVIFAGFGLLVVLTVALGLHLWVITPLNHIKASLISGQVEPVAPYLKRPDEIGRLARLIENASAQTDALRQSEAQLKNALEERLRLGRDLHDGVIQSLYATGMVLAGLQARLPAQSTDSQDKLNQSRAILNEVILDLRNFISGLEPEELQQPGFIHAVSQLLKFAESGRDVKTSCEIDENLANQLSLTHRVNILQITREALSNALRHGRATEISLGLHASETSVEYHFSDNGCGFNPGGPAPRGHGLENISLRARDLGAAFSLESRPGHGTRLKLRFELPNLHPKSS